MAKSVASNKQIISKAAGPSNFIKCKIYGNKSGAVDLMPGSIVDIKYYESILSDTIRVVIMFVDTKKTYQGRKTALEGLPIVGQEKVELIIEDNFNNRKKVEMYVNHAIKASTEPKGQVVLLDLVSKENILNEQVRVRKRYDGKISDSVKKILQEKPPYGLGTKKTCDIEQTVNLYNFIGNNRKVSYICTDLAKKGIPSTGGGKGNTAGYFFFETSEGFKFKSIDTLMKEKPKMKLLYNDTSEDQGATLPPGYDGKILELKVTDAVNDVSDKMKMGLNNTKIIRFNPVTTFYEVINQQVSSSIEKGGKSLPSLNDKDFPNKAINAATKTIFTMIDTGVLPGGNINQQLCKSFLPNFDDAQVVNRATMRYNNLFNQKVSILIPGSFQLSAGDTIFIDSPNVEDSNNQGVNQQYGGKYLISDVCHSITPKDCFTSADLIRESVGRKS